MDWTQLCSWDGWINTVENIEHSFSNISFLFEYDCKLSLVGQNSALDVRSFTFWVKIKEEEANIWVYTFTDHFFIDFSPCREFQLISMIINQQTDDQSQTRYTDDGDDDDDDLIFCLLA